MAQQSDNPQLPPASVNNIFMERDTILSMIRGDITEIKAAIKEHQTDTRDEFRRVREKIDEVSLKLSEESRTTAITLKEVETKQKTTAAIWGAVAGVLATVVASIAAGLVRMWTGGQ